MKSALLVAALALAASTTAFARDPRPDLTIAGIVTSGVRVAIGETYFYAATARNAGSTPCNWVNLTLKLPGEVDLVSATSGSPLICEPDAHIRIIGLPFDVACRGGPGFFLMPGSTVTATFTVRALRPASSVTATAVADPGGVCFESNEANNRATSTATALIQRPRLQVSQHKPFAPSGSTPPSRAPATQVFPLTITNLGPGPAVDMSLDVQHSRGLDGSQTFHGPELVVAYRGPRAAEGQTPSNPVPATCNDSSNSTTVQRNCQIRLVLQPNETLQVHYRWTACPTSPVPLAPPLIRIATTDEVPGSEHAVNVHQACRL